MVVLNEVSNMFWGITLDAGKRYTQTVETSFHISCAALEVSATADGPKQRAALMLQHEKVEFLLCTLDNKQLYQQALDLNFTEGEEVCFFVNGKGVVHLSGYLVPEDTNDGDFGEYADMGTSDDDDDEEDSDEEIPMLEALPEARSSTGKRKKSTEEPASNKKRKQAAAPEDSEDDEDSDEDPDFSEMDFDLADSDSGASDDEDDSGSDDDDDDDEDDAEEDDDDDDDSDEEEEEKAGNDLSGSFIQEKSKKGKTPNKDAKPAPSPKSEKKQKGTPKAAKATEVASPNTEGKKKKKQQQASPAPKAAEAAKTPNTEGKKKKKKQEESPAPKAAANGATPNTEGKKKKKKKQQEETQENQQTSKKAKKVILPGGTVMEDVKEGNGPEAKPGKMVHVYYKGTLQNGSVFDSVTSGKPFKFKLGKQEVIKGWDMGLQGMKVGSKRKLIIPPGQAYGSQRAGKIAPNSTLFFDVELKAVS